MRIIILLFIFNPPLKYFPFLLIFNFFISSIASFILLFKFDLLILILFFQILKYFLKLLSLFFRFKFLIIDFNKIIILSFLFLFAYIVVVSSLTIVVILSINIVLFSQIVKYFFNVSLFLFTLNLSYNFNSNLPLRFSIFSLEIIFVHLFNAFLIKFFSFLFSFLINIFKSTSYIIFSLRVNFNLSNKSDKYFLLI